MHLELLSLSQYLFDTKALESVQNTKLELQTSKLEEQHRC